MGGNFRKKEYLEKTSSETRSQGRISGRNPSLAMCWHLPRYPWYLRPRGVSDCRERFRLSTSNIGFPVVNAPFVVLN
jgi:hypothetical protein